MWKVGGIKIEFAVWYTFFLQADTEKCKKTRIFVKHSVTENFWEQRSSESLRTHLSEYLDERGGPKVFFPCFGRPKSVEGDKMRSVSKNMRCRKKVYLPQFSKKILPTGKNWFKWASSMSKIVEDTLLLQHRNFYLITFGLPPFGLQAIWTTPNQTTYDIWTTDIWTTP